MVRLNLIAELSHFFVQLLRDQFFEEFFGQNSVNLLGEEGFKIDCFDGIGYPEKRSWKFAQPSPSDSLFVFAKNWCTVGIWVANKFGIQITVLLTDQYICNGCNCLNGTTSMPKSVLRYSLDKVRQVSESEIWYWMTQHVSFIIRSILALDLIWKSGRGVKSISINAPTIHLFAIQIPSVLHWISR